MSTLKVEIVRIENIIPHPNAHSLEICTVRGWNCVTRINDFKVNDLAVYFPIDSVLPFEVETRIFGADSKVRLHNSRVKTIKLRGAISQGLLVPPDRVLDDSRGVVEGLDITQSLGITKYEPPVKFSPQSNGRQASKKEVNTNFHKYTSIENFKNYNKLFEEGEMVVVTEKIHGTNFRAGWVKTDANTFFKKIKKFFGMLPEYEFVYGSHNVQLQDKLLYSGFYDKNVYAEAVHNYNLKQVIPNGFVLYGEIYGDGIQKNYNYGCRLGERKLVIFDIQQDGQYLLDCLKEEYCGLWDLPCVPILYSGPYNAELIKGFVSGYSVLAPEQKVREGIVIKPQTEKKSIIGRKVLKMINDEYLLKDNTTEFH